MSTQIHVTVWNEYRHEPINESVRALYPYGLHGAIKRVLEQGLGAAVKVRTATLDEPEQGLTEDALRQTDVLTWWGHLAQTEVADEVVERVRARVLAGMGLIVLHASHESEIFKSLMGTSCSLRWRKGEDREVVWNVDPSHPIAAGIPPAFVIPKNEMLSEYFDIPPPESLVFISSFSGGEVFRSRCCFTRGVGRIFYFSQGHELHPVYHQPEVQRIICNAVRWANPSGGVRDESLTSQNAPAGWFEAKR